MSPTQKKVLFAAVGVLILAALGVGLVMYLTSKPASTQPATNFFGVGGNVSVGQTSQQTNEQQPTNTSLQKVFKIADGPIASAAFMQTFSPTTTLVRYILATNGHVLDMAIDVPGAAAKAASNTTIPGVVSATWGKNASSTIVQYVDSGMLKTASIIFGTTSASGAPGPGRIQFFPSNIASLALSPDAKFAVYLLKTTSGVDGYTADATGANAKKLFSLPLSQVLVAWPSQNTILVETKSAAGVPGVALAVNAKTGQMTPMLYTPGLSANANSAFSKILFQTVTDASSAAASYVHDIKTGRDVKLSASPLPEKCLWSQTSPSSMYCAAPSSPQAGYADAWHKGLVQSPDTIFYFDADNAVSTSLMYEGQGGVSGPIDQLGISPDGNYLLFITRGDRSLWGVRL